MRDLLHSLMDKALKQGADEVDAILIDSTSLSAEVRLDKVINIERSEDAGLGLRVMINGKQAMVSTADLSKDSLNAVVERAISMAKVTPADPYLSLASKEQIVDKIIDLDLYDAHEPSAEFLIEQAKNIEQVALSNDQVTNSDGASAAYQANKIHVATSNGFYHHYQTSYSSLGIGVIAGKDDKMQTGSDFSLARFASDLKSPEKIGKEAVARAIAKLNPRTIATAEMPVIFENKMAARLLGAFASAINGQAIARGTSFLIDHLGKEIFNPNILIIDDPFIKRGLGSRPFDAEAILGSKLNIVENGILNNYFLDLSTAKKLNMQTTGHASRGLSSAPSPGNSNLYIANGKFSLQDLIKSIKKGLFITEIFGHGANIVTGDYSQGVVGFYIENGEIAYPVSEITVAGSLKTMFKQMIAANDLKMEFSMNSPSLMIENMTIAGI